MSDGEDSSEQGRRPVIYLDQNKWVTLAQARVSPDKIENKKELGAADAVWRAIEADKIIVPLANAHLVETARAGTTERRQALAESMLKGYRGWHMRHPLDVRRDELVEFFQNRQGQSVSGQLKNFDQAPGTPFPEASRDGLYSASEELAESDRDYIQRIAWIRGWADTLRTGVDTGDVRAASDQMIEAWASGFEELGRYMGDNPVSRDVRFVAAGKLMTDLTNEIAATAARCELTTDEFAAALHPDGLVQAFSNMPFVGRLLEVTHQRLRNPQTRWRRNDLNDMTYLCCAAAYADYVVAEKATAHYLQVGRDNFPSGAIVLKNLSELREYLRLQEG